MKLPFIRLTQAVAVTGLLALSMHAQASKLKYMDPAACQARADEKVRRQQQYRQLWLDSVAQALKLQPNQQAAWKNYLTAELAIPVPMLCSKADETDDQHARALEERTQQMAGRLSASGKAHAELWRILTAEQRQTLDHMRFNDDIYGRDLDRNRRLRLDRP